MNLESLDCNASSGDPNTLKNLDFKDESKESEWQNPVQEIQEVIPGLFLGPFTAASEKKHLSALIESGITHIIYACRESKDNKTPFFPDHFKCFMIKFDSFSENIIPFLPHMTVFIDSCFKTGGKVLVHSNWGAAKSAILVIAYIMETRDISLSDAYLVVQRNNGLSVNPDEDYLRQLMEYEPIVKAKKTHMNGHTSKETGQLKRRLNDLEEVDRLMYEMDVCEDETAQS